MERPRRRRYVMRRWDGYAPLKPELETAFIQLENGIQVQFEQGKEYEAGDYWLIPARTIDNSLEWPEGDEYQRPHGVEHAYVELAEVVWKGAGWAEEPIDKRHIFQPLISGVDLTVKSLTVEDMATPSKASG